MAVDASADTDAFDGQIQVGTVQKNKGNAGDLNPDGKGRQTWRGLSLGMDFRVVSDHPVFITQLGVWDDNGDGLLSDHTLSLYDITGGVNTLIASVEIAAGEGSLRDDYRYIKLPSTVELAPGTEFAVVVSYGAANADSNGNSGKPGQDLEPTPLFNGDGMIEGIGTARYGAGPFPGVLDTGPFNRYHSGSFSFEPNPEPSTFVLLGGVLAAAGIIRRRRRKARA